LIDGFKRKKGGQYISIQNELEGENLMSEESHVLIGKKPVMKYVSACMASFNAGSKRVVLKARGKAISRAVDAAELLRRVFMKDVEVEKIEIGTDEVERQNGIKLNVSTMEISLIKK